MPAEHPHPLDPLTAQEIRATAVAVRARDGATDLMFAAISLREPDKEVVHAFDAGTLADAPRHGLAICYRPTTRTTIEVDVDLSSGTIDRWSEHPGAKPVYLQGDAARVNLGVRADARWQAAMRARGIADFEQVQLDPWNGGHLGEEVDEGGRRTARVLSYLRPSPDHNPYAQPIEGVLVVADFDTGEVIDVVDTGRSRLPPDGGRFGASRDEPRREVAALEITQPSGPGFTVDGNRIDWQGFRLRASLHPTEGLVLHTVSYGGGGGARRPILHRASMAEMAVPYAGTDVVHSWRAPMDVGEVGLGLNANSLTLGCDCLGEIRYLDAVMALADGDTYTIVNAICIHEEDAGLLWKHTDPWTERVDVRRSRRLVISSISTIGNYDYAFYWYLYQDGTLQFDVRLTGVIAVRVGDGSPVDDGTYVTETIVGLNHQHLFCLRLDFDIDGRANSVYEVETVRVPRGPENPRGNHFRVSRRRLDRESDAQRVVDPSVGRHWVITNPHRLNAVGSPVGYRIVPGYHGVLLADATSAIARRCGFATKNLWVTPFEPAERHASGDYPNNHPGGDGLPRWTERDRDLVATDLVVWYTLGVTHLPRPEDWPVMPVEIASVTFKPAGFFDENPTLDVPPPDNC